MGTNRTIPGTARGGARSDLDLSLSRADLADEDRQEALRDSVRQTPMLQELVPETTYQRIELPLPAGWTAYNPSICQTRRGLVMAVRSSNWEFKRHQYFRVHASDGVPRNQNYLVAIDSSLRPASQILLQDGTDRIGAVASAYRGYADLRVFEYRGELKAVANTLEFSPYGISQMALLDIRGERLTRRQFLSDGKTRPEKNWVPAIWNDELLFVYGFSPMTLLHWDGNRLRPAGPISYAGPALAKEFRGGSQLVAIDQGYLTVVHIGADFADGSRVYLHRFVRLDDEFRLAAVSPQFMFHGPGIEFAAGLAIVDDTVIVSFGVADAECWLAQAPLASILGIASTPVAP